MTPRGRGRLLLAAGAVVGLALAVAGVLAPEPGSALGPNEAARVNGVSIGAAELERAFTASAADRRTPVGPSERERILSRLIDEELLVQRGLALGLAESDAAVRKALAQAVISAAVAEASAVEPQAGELEEFFAANRAYFTPPGRARVGVVFVANVPGSDARIGAALAALDAGEPVGAVRAKYGDGNAPELPDALLPETKLIEILGPRLTGVALSLAPGQRGPIVEGPAGRAIPVLLEREGATEVELVQVREQVQAEWLRRAGERALAAYLERLRADATLQLGPGAPEPGAP